MIKQFSVIFDVKSSFDLSEDEILEELLKVESMINSLSRLRFHIRDPKEIIDSKLGLREKAEYDLNEANRRFWGTFHGYEDKK